MKAFFDNIARLVFGMAAGLLMLLAIALVGDAIWQFIKVLKSGENVGITALTGIDYIVVAIAVFDVGKYLFDEEMMRGREMRGPSETRKSLTRFISTIVIAIFLEALVTVFRTAEHDVEKLIYPTLLLIAAILLILGLGLFQQLSVNVETALERNNRIRERRNS